LSAARRRIVETRLRAGDLRALVATASLELGIDVGPVELVCQIGSPRAIGTFLQRSAGPTTNAMARRSGGSTP
jgi:ATP-dependent Lhr-like helicase